MKRVLGGLFGLAALGCLLWGGEVAIDTLANPWAHSSLGGLTLTGTWVGEFSNLDGHPQLALLELRRTMTPAGRYEDEDSRITGELQVCGSTPASYTLAGDPQGWSGRTFVITRIRVQSPPKPLGYYFHNAQGSWEGDRLNLGVKHAYFQEDGGLFASGSRYPGVNQTLQLELKRGSRDRFDQACSSTRKAVP
ncbi:hypothetical protein [Paludibaculum fermentans]|uniref:hypothetical protein n=1 Tax=Paludibaculum fermentans TaxID=1473598 RepID=UPI003EB7DEA6